MNTLEILKNLQERKNKLIKFRETLTPLDYRYNKIVGNISLIETKIEDKIKNAKID